MCGITHVSSVIGANEWEEYDERESFYSSFLNAQSSHLDSFNNFLTNCLGSDPNNAAYQNSRYYTNTGLTAVSFLAGGYGIARAGYSAIFAGSKAAGAATQASKCAGQFVGREVGFAAREGVTAATKSAGRNRFVPNANATGAHTVFRRDLSTGKVAHYETFRPQTNPRNPTPWESFKRYDGPGGVDDRHYNKVLKRYIDTPHIHDPYVPGGIRVPESWEIPN